MTELESILHSNIVLDKVLEIVRRWRDEEALKLAAEKLKPERYQDPETIGMGVGSIAICENVVEFVLRLQRVRGKGDN